MGVERVLSMGERLQRLLDGAEKEVEAKISEAEMKATELISKARTDAERRRTMAQRGYGIDELLKEAEEKATKEAEKKLEDYKKQVEAVKDVSEEKMKEAVAFVLKDDPHTFTNPLFVIHDEDEFRSSLSLSNTVIHGSDPPHGININRKFDSKNRSALCSNGIGQRTSMFLRNTLSDSKAESDPFLPRTEIGIEDMVQVVTRNTGSVISH